MKYIVYLMITGLLCLAFILSAYELLKIPRSTKRGRKNFKKYKKSVWTRINIESAIIRPLAKQIGKLIPINKHKALSLQVRLQEADIDYTPGEYYARAIIIGILPMLICPLFVYLRFPLLILAVLVLSIVLIFNAIDINSVIKKRQYEIRRELPRFIRAIISGLNSNRDLIQVVEKYQAVSRGVMQNELIKLLAALRSGNAEKAYMNFGQRFNMPEITQLVTALINLERGIDQTSTLQFLAADTAQMIQDSIKIEMAKRPRILRRAMIPAMIVVFLMLLYVIVANFSDYITILY